MLCPHNISAGHSRSASNPLLVKLPKSQITAQLHSFISLFFPPLEQIPSLSSIPLFPSGLQNSCPPPPLIFPHPKPRSFLPPFCEVLITVPKFSFAFFIKIILDEVTSNKFVCPNPLDNKSWDQEWGLGIWKIRARAKAEVVKSALTDLTTTSKA